MSAIVYVINYFYSYYKYKFISEHLLLLLKIDSSLKFENIYKLHKNSLEILIC